MTDMNVNQNIIYVYELPYAERMEFCKLLDINEKWRELGGKFMKFDYPSLCGIGKAYMRGQSPTDELLTEWGQQKHTILELFIILNEMKHYQAMTILRPFVNPKYHKLISQGVKSFNNIVKMTGSNSPNEKSNHDELNTESSPKGKNFVKNEVLNKSGKLNEQAHSDLSVYCPSAEASIPLITYAELELGTNYWNKSNILGEGGFGVVFRGTWKNTPVAIKRLEPKKEAKQNDNILEVQRQQSFRELKYLNSYRHVNILPIFGFSIGGEKPCLVYQYMVNGSLEDRLQCRQGTKPLTWNIRLKIATETARGLQFLHGMDKPLVHGDIKSANILLDQCFEPRIGDFGLAREGPIQEYTHVEVSHVHGTKPYLPDEFLRGKQFSTKVDTYGFGVVLFEIATGLKAYEKFRDQQFLKAHVENHYSTISDLADAKAGPDENNVFLSLIEIGKKCVSYLAKHRPQMEQVLRQLDCLSLPERQLSTNNRYSYLPTYQNEPMKRLSTPSRSNNLLPIYSPIPSNPLVKLNPFPAPHFGATTVPDQVGEIMPPIEENNCLIKSTSSNSERILNVSSSKKSQIRESETQKNVEEKNSAHKNHISGEDDDDHNDILPLITQLQL